MSIPVISYDSRAGRLQYLWDTYRDVLQGQRILDVGADDCHLKKYIDDTTQYLGIGLGGSPDQIVDLETGVLPFEDQSFDVVICLDVLEHLEKIHAIVDECCRVARKAVILSLPNPLCSLWHRLARFGEWEEGRLLKYYGLPVDAPEDRHRWFFDVVEAQAFIHARAAQNGLSVERMDRERIQDPSRTWRARWRRWVGRHLFQVPRVEERLDVVRLWALLRRTE